MKTKYFYLLFLLALVSSCTSSSDKVHKAEENVKKANMDLEKQRAELEKEINAYKYEKEQIILNNEKSIEYFDQRINQQKLSDKENYEQKILDLKKKNTDLKKKITDFNTDNKEKWNAFKEDFGRDMEELGSALRDFTVSDKE